MPGQVSPLKARLTAWVIRGAIEGDGLRRKLLIAEAKKYLEEKMLQNTSWRTTTGGIGMILGGLGVLGGLLLKISNEGLSAIDQSAITAGSAAFASISGGVALIFARDNKVTSEQVNAGK